MAAPESTSTATSTAASLSRRPVVGVLVDRQTYLNAVYLLVSFPLGILYLTLLLLGFSLGLGLLITLVGIPILLVTVVGSTYPAALEREQARRLLGVDVESPTRSVEGDGLWPTVRSYLVARETWFGILFLLAKFPLGVASFVLLAVLFGVTVGFLTAPLYYSLPGAGISVGTWTVTTLPEAAAVSILGVGLLFVSLHVLNAVAWASGRVAAVLLGAK
jgi:hypothetical protein